MRRIHKNSLLLLVVVLLLSACDKHKPEGLLPPAKLEALLYDYHLVQAIVNDIPSSERYKKDCYFDYIYAKHGVTKEELDSSLVYYARYPDGLADIYTRLSERIAQDIQRIEDAEIPEVKREPITIEGDSVDMWYDARIIQLMASPIENRYSFMVPVDTNFKSGDRIEWGGEVLFLNTVTDSLCNYLYLDLAVTYTNDSLLVADTLMYASDTYSLVVSDTSDVIIKSIKGSAYLKGEGGSNRVLLLQPRLIRERKIDDTDTTVN